MAGFLRAVQLLCSAAKGTGQLIELGAACLNRKAVLGQLLHSDWHVLVKPWCFRATVCLYLWCWCKPVSFAPPGLASEGRVQETRASSLVLGAQCRGIQACFLEVIQETYHSGTMSELLVCVCLEPLWLFVQHYTLVNFSGLITLSALFLW